MARPDLRQFGGGDGPRETLHAIVARVHLEQQGRGSVDGVGVVPGMRAVGRADFHETAAGAFHDLRDAEAAADLDQFAPGHGHRGAESQGIEDQQDGRSVVVDDGRGLRAGQELQPVLDDAFPVPPPTAFEIVLEGDGRRRHRHGAAQRLLAEQRAPEVRVDDRAGQVEDAPVAVPDVPCEPRFHRLRVARGVGGPVGNFSRAGLRLQPAHGVLDGGKSAPCDGPGQGPMLQHGVDTREGAAGHPRQDPSRAASPSRASSCRIRS